ncbi:DUF1993 family protein [Loktanella agnita]|uniref:DUF1993 family protein n=1 Tax=Loktanella agnita TaxID=287097 RepID=UPI003986F1DC
MTYDQSVPVALQALDRALALLDHATPAMLSTQLRAGILDCAAQFHTVAGFALRASFPLTGKTSPNLPEGDPRHALEAARDALLSLTEADFTDAQTKSIAHRAGFADLDQSAQEYLQHFALPNLWFHLCMAFAIMRQQGADIGKADFDRLHAYPPGFSWVD